MAAGGPGATSTPEILNSQLIWPKQDIEIGKEHHKLPQAERIKKIAFIVIGSIAFAAGLALAIASFITPVPILALTIAIPALGILGITSFVLCSTLVEKPKLVELSDELYAAAKALPYNNAKLRFETLETGEQTIVYSTSDHATAEKLLSAKSPTLTIKAIVKRLLNEGELEQALNVLSHLPQEYQSPALIEEIARVIGDNVHKTIEFHFTQSILSVEDFGFKAEKLTTEYLRWERECVLILNKVRLLPHVRYNSVLDETLISILNPRCTLLPTMKKVTDYYIESYHILQDIDPQDIPPSEFIHRLCLPMTDREHGYGEDWEKLAAIKVAELEEAVQKKVIDQVEELTKEDHSPEDACRALRIPIETYNQAKEFFDRKAQNERHDAECREYVRLMSDERLSRDEAATRLGKDSSMLELRLHSLREREAAQPFSDIRYS